MCQTLAIELRPFRSTVYLDGARTDHDDVQDIAFDGDPIES